MGITDIVKWRAVYDDGTFLDEVEQNGTDHLFKEIQFSKIKLFQLMNENKIAVCQVRLGDDKRLIFTRRNLKVAGAELVELNGVNIQVPVKSHQIIIILGWQKTVNKINVKSIFYLMPDGRIELDDEWREKEHAIYTQVDMPTNFV